MVNLLVRQLGHELFNHALYGTFAAYYAQNGLWRLSDYFKSRAFEEYHHHEWLRDYLCECHVEFSYPLIKSVDYKILDDAGPFVESVNAEILTTQMIYEIFEAATAEKDYQTKLWLKRLIDEQVEEEGLSLRALDIAEMDIDWLTKQVEIMELYRK